jgi:nitrogen fixation NifU-like protein
MLYANWLGTRFALFDGGRPATRCLLESRLVVGTAHKLVCFEVDGARLSRLLGNKVTDMSETERLSDAARQRADHPENYGEICPCEGHARITGPCGDTIEIWIQTGGDHIDKIGFTTTGCGSSRAAGSMATELALGKHLSAAEKIEQADILHALNGLPARSEHCALLAATTLQAAIKSVANKPDTVAR